MEFIKRPEMQIPIYIRKEVLVVGGGVAGLSAAVASARLGCKTILVEESGQLGGTVTLGLNTNFMGVDLSVNRGFFLEFYEKLKDNRALIEGFHSPIDPEVFKWVAFDFIEKEDIELLLHTRVVDVIRNKNKILGVFIENKSGCQAIMSDVVVDTSGDADVATKAGEAFDRVKKDEHALTLLFRISGADIYKFVDYIKSRLDKNEFFPIGSHQDTNIIEMDKEKPLVAIGGFKGLIKKARRKGELYLTHDNMWIVFLPTKGTALVNATHIIGLDPVSSKDLTLAEIECRKQMISVFSFLKKNIPGFENISLMDSASRIGIRESRRIIGEYVLKYDDIKKGQSFDDAIAVNFMPVDIHGPGEKQTWIKLEGPYDIPYRSLQARVHENLLLAGRCISVDHMVQGSIRSVPCCFSTGQAAGTAAGLSILEKKNPKKINLVRLQDELKKHGAVVSRKWLKI
jgi:hypothetical protein